MEACKFHYVVPSFFGQAKFIELRKMKEKKRLQASNGVLCLKRILALGVEERKHLKSQLNFWQKNDAKALSLFWAMPNKKSTFFLIATRSFRKYCSQCNCLRILLRLQWIIVKYSYIQLQKKVQFIFVTRLLIYLNYQMKTRAKLLNLVLQGELVIRIIF